MKRILSGLAVLTALVFLASCSSFDKQLEEAAVVVNKTCPMAVDSETRLDSAKAGKNSFSYYYTLVNYNKADIDTSKIKPTVSANILTNLRTNAALKVFRDHKVTMVYHYYDKAGQYLMEMVYTDKDYSK